MTEQLKLKKGITLEDVILRVISEVDYDIAKQYDPETSELDEDEIQDELNSIVESIKVFFE